MRTPSRTPQYQKGCAALQDKTNEQTDLISSVALEDTDQHDFTRWSDGSITIEHLMFQFTQSANDFDHVRLSKEEVDTLCNFLNPDLA